MTYVRTTRDEWVVELNYGYGDGWEEACAEETRREGLARLREYRENQPEYPARLRKRRVPLAAEPQHCACGRELYADGHCSDGGAWCAEPEAVPA